MMNTLCTSIYRRYTRAHTHICLYVHGSFITGIADMLVKLCVYVLISVCVPSYMSVCVV